MRKYFLFVIVLALFSFSGTSLKKRISDTLFRYEFYTTDKQVSPEPDREYFWFKGGAIHSAEFGIGGELLHEEFLKFYHSNQLAESGKYKNGLKTGIWKEWFKNGILQSKTYWNDGQRDGSYYAYDLSGALVEEGKFKDNRKHGRWINYVRKDTLKYRNGELIIKKSRARKGIFSFLKKKDTIGTSEGGEAVKAKDSAAPGKIKKAGFFKRIFTKKEENGNKEAGRKITREKKVKQPDSKEPKKEGFFKRLFSKKEKK